jgi:hypothetical protein
VFHSKTSLPSKINLADISPSGMFEAKSTLRLVFRHRHLWVPRYLLFSTHCVPEGYGQSSQQSSADATNTHGHDGCGYVRPPGAVQGYCSRTTTASATIRVRIS